MRSERVLLPAAVAALTLVSTLGAAAAGPGLAGLAPLLLPPLWGWLVLRIAAPGPPLAAAAAWLGAAAVMAPPAATLVIAAYVLAGLGAGRVFLAGGRLQGALLAAAIPLAGLSIWAVAGEALPEALQQSGRDVADTVVRSLPPDLSAAAREAAVAEVERQAAAAGKLVARFWPALLALGVLVHAGLIVAVVRWLGGRWGRAGGLRRLPPPTRWRLPFTVVWALAAGLALVAFRREPALGAGLNLALTAAALIALQGLAVQVELVGRALSPWGRALFWTVGAFFLGPVLVAAGLLLGLADQWLDLRRIAGGRQPPSGD